MLVHLSGEKHIFLWKVSSVEPIRGKELYSPVREYTCSFSWEAFSPVGRFTVWSLWGGEIYLLVRECICAYLPVEKHFSLWKVYSVRSMREGTLFPGERVYMFFQLKSIFPSERFTVWSLWGKELFSLVRKCTIHVFSVEKPFSLWKVYSVESMREGTLFPG